MSWFGRLAVSAVVFVLIATAVLTRPGIAAAECAPNMSRNPTTLECKQPPAPPGWYAPPPPYAPAYAPRDVPPPPPTPPWAKTDPVWSNGFQRWGIVIGTAWVPL